MKIFRFMLLFVLSLGLITVAFGAAPGKAAIASAHPLATRAGMEVLAAGGNAFDAAVVVSATLAVVEPYSSGLGGGGFWLLHRAKDGHEVMLDGRETAPAAAHKKMYLDVQGQVIPKRSIDGPLAAGIPGLPAALVHLAKHYGRLPLTSSLAPAIRHARAGFPVTALYQRRAKFRLEALKNSPAAASVFLHQGQPPPEGRRIIQPDLAATLERLAKKGHAGFYRGEFARKLVDGVRAAGGIWTLDDLAKYRVVERAPVVGRYRGMRVVAAAPPSSGGVVLLEALNILEGFALHEYDSVLRKHLTIEAMRRAYRDRAEYLGDPDHVAMPLARLLSKSYAGELRDGVRFKKATPSALIVAEENIPEESKNTSHLSVLDAAGNYVAATLSINYPFGAAFVPSGTGVLLNDEMDDFAAAPGQPNVYGLVGNDANAIAPGKRPLSSMTPTFLEKDGRIAVLGTPGGSRIISMVLLATLDFAAGNPPNSWVSLGRFHHQYLPDRVEFEPGALTEVEKAGLRSRGHQLEELADTYGNMQAILWDKTKGTVQAASDPRGEGETWVEPGAK
jgi:gamma-glutamyltranspeptidase/glutathione hydrolase